MQIELNFNGVAWSWVESIHAEAAELRVTTCLLLALASFPWKLAGLFFLSMLICQICHRAQSFSTQLCDQFAWVTGQGIRVHIKAPARSNEQSYWRLVGLLFDRSGSQKPKPLGLHGWIGFRWVLVCTAAAPIMGRCQGGNVGKPSAGGAAQVQPRDWAASGDLWWFAHWDIPLRWIVSFPGQ